MTWNYRLMKHKDALSSTGYIYIVHEVYYDKNRKPDGWTDEGVKICGDNLKEVLRVLEMIKKDIRKSPPLDYK